MSVHSVICYIDKAKRIIQPAIQLNHVCNTSVVKVKTIWQSLIHFCNYESWLIFYHSWNSKYSEIILPNSRSPSNFKQWWLSWAICYLDRYFLGYLLSNRTSEVTFSYYPSCTLNSQYIWKWTNANPMKILGLLASHPKLLIGSKLSLS